MLPVHETEVIPMVLKKTHHRLFSFLVLDRRIIDSLGGEESSG